MNLFLHSSAAKRFALLILCMVLVAAAAVSFALEGENSEPYSYEWFMEPDDSVPTRSRVFVRTQSDMPALLMFDPSYEGQYLWKLQFIFEEVTGIPFTIEKLTEVTFGQDNVVIGMQEYIGEEILMLLPDTTLQYGRSMGFNVGVIPGGGESAFGVAIEGTDVLGNALTFTCLAPLSYEVSDMLTRGYFTVGAAQEEGKPYIAIETEHNPIPQIYNPVFAGNYGWQWFYSIENVTDEPFTVSRIVEALLVGDNVVHASEYTKEQFDEWGVSPEFVKGTPFTGGSGANTQQGFEELGLLVEGVDKDGNEMVFAALIPFSKERPQE